MTRRKWRKTEFGFPSCEFSTQLANEKCFPYRTLSPHTLGFSFTFTPHPQLPPHTVLPPHYDLWRILLCCKISKLGDIFKWKRSLWASWLWGRDLCFGGSNKSYACEVMGFQWIAYMWIPVRQTPILPYEIMTWIKLFSFYLKNR